MVIDINILRTDRGGNPQIVLQSEKDRFKGTAHVERVLELDQNWRTVRHKLDTLNRHKKICSKSIGKHMSQQVVSQSNGICKSCDDPLSYSLEDIQTMSLYQLKSLSTQIDTEVKNVTAQLKQTQQERDQILSEIGNILHPSVVISDNEDNNKVERVVGDCQSRKRHSHIDLLLMINGADYKRGSMIAGDRGYFLLGPGVFLAQALIQYGLRVLEGKGYNVLYTPFFMQKKIMQEVAQLSQFDEELYKITSKSSGGEAENQETEKYLIATSEQTLAAFHRDEWLSPEILPIKYAGISTCFRQEVGSHGRDTAGIFRVHQFEKVEQFVICSPFNGESWKIFDDMINNSEEFVKDLGISYRVVSIVSGALNNAAAKKLDLEAWFPGSGAFRELVSCSNCTDYQSRKLAIRYGCTKKLNQDVPYVHMLNSTLCAVTRTLCCLLETHQTDSGINVPECLHPYLPQNMRYIPFVKKN